MSEDIRETVNDLLRSLGGSKEQVAESLRDQRIRGFADDACECPVAIYLKQSGVNTPAVDQYGVALEAYEKDDEGPVQVQLPPPVRQFIRAFDNGDFADLNADLNVA